MGSSHALLNDIVTMIRSLPQYVPPETVRTKLLQTWGKVPRRRHTQHPKLSGLLGAPPEALPEVLEAAWRELAAQLSQDPEDPLPWAVEVFQETAVRALAGQQNFQGHSMQKAWVHGIKKNVRRELWRKLIREARLLAEYGPQIRDMLHPAPAQIPEHVYARLKQVVDQLPKLDRVYLGMRFGWNGVPRRPMTDIVRDLGIPRSTAYWQEDKLLSMLRELLDDGR